MLLLEFMSSKFDYAAKEIRALSALRVCVYLGCLPSDGVCLRKEKKEGQEMCV